MILFLLLFIFDLKAETLSISEKLVSDSALKHFPQILAAFQNVEYQKGVNLKAIGQLDAKLKGDSNARQNGPYGGDLYKIYIEKELQTLNSQIYAGKRHSFGKVPEYDAKDKTLDDGELYAGLSISLLRNSFADEQRLEIWNTRLSTEISNLELRSIQLEVKYKAIEAYWNFVVSQEKVKLAKQNLNISIDRMQQIKTRVNKGDLARIYITENEQYIIKRKNYLIDELKNNFEKMLILSLFLRDEEGLPINLLAIKDIQYKLDEPRQHKNDEVANLSSIDVNPDIKIMDLKIDQIKNSIRYAQNNFLPELDLKIEQARDTSANDPTLNQNETKIMLQLEIPIEYNKLSGDLSALRAKEKITNYQRQFKVESLSAKITTLVQKQKYTAEKYFNTVEEADLAYKLITAEQKKFQQGSSDFFVVNLREQNWFETKSKQFETMLDYFLTTAEINRLTVFEIE